MFNVFPLIFLAFQLVTPPPQAPPSALPVPAPAGQVSQIPSSRGLSQPDYKLGPGDTLRVTVWTGAEYLEQALTLSNDGTILIPFFVNKIVNLSDMTAVEVRTLIRGELLGIFRDPVVQVLTVGFESKKATLLGEMRTVGTFPVFSSSRLLEFVLNGQTTANSNLAVVQVTRATGERLVVNLYDIVTRGDYSQNLFIQPDDIVFVPSVETISNKYFVMGEVRTPGIIQSGEPLRLLDAISRAGTLTLAGRDSEILIIRAQNAAQDDEQAEIIRVAFSEIYKKGNLSANVALNNGDIVFVPKRRIQRVTEIIGTVTPIMSFIRDTILFNDALRPDNP